ncbi:hypothetical protein [Roseobacter sp. TSBP12]|uniref:hypothetical protein n=1 Tax=Roseobacter sp. TSBP12 TaxID=1236613 RepID=UPI00125F6A6C|nr:hypothetical protein [Roseobacter sp. TSBP12]KAB6717746.1 hypothetical protein C8029_04290 [Roseobacter sp. TSBP12]
MTKTELDIMAEQSQSNPSARINFGVLLAFFYDAGLLEFREIEKRPTRTASDVRTDNPAM